MELKDTDIHIDRTHRFPLDSCRMGIWTHVETAEDCGSVAACISDLS